MSMYGTILDFGVLDDENLPYCYEGSNRWPETRGGSLEIASLAAEFLRVYVNTEAVVIDRHQAELLRDKLSWWLDIPR